MKVLLSLILLVVLATNSIDGKIYINCDDEPCQHGTCTDLYRKTAYECRCDTGWEGENCDQSLSNQAQQSVETDKDIEVEVKNPIPVEIDIPNRKANPCGGPCKNNGFCDDQKKRCEVCVFLLERSSLEMSW